MFSGSRVGYCVGVQVGCIGGCFDGYIRESGPGLECQEIAVCSR